MLPESQAVARTAGGILPLRLEKLLFRRDGQPLVDEIGAVIGPNGRTVVLGPNGAGKSLLLRLCHGLIQPTSGRIDWNGHSMSAARDRQAMVFQEPVLLRRSALANIRHALALKNVAWRDRNGRAREALKLAGLGDLANRPARVLSGGEKQRLAIARAWATRPEVIFLDEPTSRLDPAATRGVEALIATIAETGTKVIMTTHDLGQARRLADDVLFLHRGRLLEHEAADAFFDSPRSAEAAAFLTGDLLW